MEALHAYMDSVKNPYLTALLKEDLLLRMRSLRKRFKNNSAAKSVHHGIYRRTSGAYAFRDGQLRITWQNIIRYSTGILLISAALLHDVGKTKELSLFPENDYTDEGNLLGHIVIGAQMVDAAANTIPDFPKTLKAELEALYSCTSRKTGIRISEGSGAGGSSCTEFCG